MYDFAHESKEQKSERAGEIVRILLDVYPDACCSLDFRDPFQLVVATILAAQCTDERVNMVTPALFDRYPDVRAFAEADFEELCELVRSTGFYRNKARHIIECAQGILADHGGSVPDNMEDLLSLSGIGRKTANLVLGDCFGIPSVVVDTHVKRITGKLGLTKNTQPDKIEFDLRDILPEKYYTAFNHVLVFHGRAVCSARKPKCEGCPISHLCYEYSKTELL